MQVHDPAFLRYLRSNGWSNAEPLAVGMEGAVYRLGDGTIAKLWGQQTVEQLDVLARFYSQLNDALTGLQAPMIVDVLHYEGRILSIERELPGIPLSEFVVEGSPTASAEAVEATLFVLDALRQVDIPAARELRVLGEVSPWVAADEWQSALIDLMDQRLSQFGDQLRTAVPELDARVAFVRDAVSAMISKVSVIHGDIVPANILVGTDMTPLAVLDLDS